MGKRPLKPKRPRKPQNAHTANNSTHTVHEPLLTLDDMCSAEYLRSLPEGLTEVRLPVSLIHSLLLKLAGIPPEDLQRALAQMQPPPAARADDRSGPRTTEAEALEAAVMSSLPAEIVERIYDRFDVEGCRCPARCEGLFHVDEFEQHCMEHVEHDQDLPPLSLDAPTPANSSLAPTPSPAPSCAPAAPPRPAAAPPGPVHPPAHAPPSAQPAPEADAPGKASNDDTSLATTTAATTTPTATATPTATITTAAAAAGAAVSTPLALPALEEPSDPPQLVAYPISEPSSSSSTASPSSLAAPSTTHTGDQPTPAAAATAETPASPAAATEVTSAASATAGTTTTTTAAAAAAAAATATPTATEIIRAASGPPSESTVSSVHDANAPATSPAPSTPAAVAAAAASSVPAAVAAAAAALQDSISWLAEDADWDEEDSLDVLDGLDDLAPMPEFLEDGAEVVLRIPPKQPPVDGDADEDDGLESLLEWLYFDAEQAIKDRWAGLLAAFKKTNRRIADLNPRIERREHILRIRGQIASEYQRRLAAMVPTGDQEHHRRRMYVEEVSCLATVTHHYLAITRHRLATLRRNVERSLQVSRRMQENIAELGRQSEAHQREIERLDVNELRLIKEELALAQEGGAKAGKRRAQRALDAEKNRQTKEDLLKRVDSCQRRAAAMRDKYCRMLKTCLSKRERVMAQERMEATLARLHSQSLLSLHEYEPATYTNVQQQQQQAAVGPLGRPLTTQDLQPILDFEKQESEALEALVDEHAAQVDARAQVFELMRELAYTDPFVKVLKEATLVRLDQMAAEDRQRRKELARVQQQERAAQRVAIQRALLEDEAEAQRKAQEKEREKARLAAKAKQQQAQKELLKKASRAAEEKQQAAAQASSTTSVAAPVILGPHAVLLPEAPIFVSTDPESSDDSEEADHDSDSGDRSQDERTGSRRDTKAKQRPLCRDNLRGCCPRGAACTWLHLDNSGDGSALPICKDFQRGLCYREPCAFQHVGGPKQNARATSTAPKPNGVSPQPQVASTAATTTAAAAARPRVAADQSSASSTAAVSPLPPSAAASSPAPAPSQSGAAAALPATHATASANGSSTQPPATIASIVAGHAGTLPDKVSMPATPSTASTAAVSVSSTVSSAKAAASVTVVSTQSPAKATAAAAATSVPAVAAPTAPAPLLHAPLPAESARSNANSTTTTTTTTTNNNNNSSSSSTSSSNTSTQNKLRAASAAAPPAVSPGPPGSLQGTADHRSLASAVSPQPPSSHHPAATPPPAHAPPPMRSPMLSTGSVLFNANAYAPKFHQAAMGPQRSLPMPGDFSMFQPGSLPNGFGAAPFSSTTSYAPQPFSSMMPPPMPAGPAARSPAPKSAASPRHIPITGEVDALFSMSGVASLGGRGSQPLPSPSPAWPSPVRQGPSDARTAAALRPPVPFNGAPPMPAPYAPFNTMMYGGLFASPAQSRAGALPGHTPWSSSASNGTIDGGWPTDRAAGARLNDAAYTHQTQPVATDDSFEFSGSLLDDDDQYTLRFLSEPNDAFPVDPPRSLEGTLVPSMPLDDSLDVFLRAAVELLRHTPGFKELVLSTPHVEHKRCVFCALRHLFRSLQHGPQYPGVTVEALRLAVLQAQLPLLRPGVLAVPGQMLQDLLQHTCRAAAFPPATCSDSCPVHRAFGRVFSSRDACSLCDAACMTHINAAELAHELLTSQNLPNSLPRLRVASTCPACHQTTDFRLPAGGINLALSLAWDKHISPEAALSIVSNIDPRLPRPDGTAASLGAMMCLRGGQYHVFFANSSSAMASSWMEFAAHEGGPARTVGAWADVQLYCRRENLLPALLIYEARSF